MVIQTNEKEFKGKTFQEYLNWKYPTKEDKEGVKGHGVIHVGTIKEKRNKAGITELLEGGELDLSGFVNVETVRINKGIINDDFLKIPLITKLNISGLVNLKKLSCWDNSLTSVDFLNQLPNPEKLEELEIFNNNIQPTDISFFSKFVNLKELKIGITGKQGKHNKFYGSLKAYQNLTKLERICIEGTDVNEGLEYLPESLVKASKKRSFGVIECSPRGSDAKCKAIQDQLRLFNYDLEAWQLAHPEKMIIARPELFTNSDNKEKWLNALNKKLSESYQLLAQTKEQEADKTAKIERLKTCIKLLEATKTYLERELALTKQNHNNQLKELATIIFPSSSDIRNINFGNLKEQARKVKAETSWKTKIKHLTLGGLVALGGQKTYHLYYGNNNLTFSPINHNNFTWLDNIYLNIPFNEPEYNNLTSLLRLPQTEQKDLEEEEINSILFPDNNLSDLKVEITRLKITDLTIQIPNKKNELEKLITETKNKLNKAENYLLEQLLTENLASEKLIELKTALSDHSIEIILIKQQELKDLESHLERLQNSQLEAKIEIYKSNA